jgi:hypothetical protein
MHRGTDETSDISQRDLVNGVFDTVPVEWHLHDGGFAEKRPATLIQVPWNDEAGQGRKTECQWPPIGFETPSRPPYAAVEITGVARIEGTDRIQPLRRMAGIEPDRPGAVILYRCRRPGAKARGFETPDDGEFRLCGLLENA